MLSQKTKPELTVISVFGSWSSVCWYIFSLFLVWIELSNKKYNLDSEELDWVGRTSKINFLSFKSMARYLSALLYCCKELFNLKSPLLNKHFAHICVRIHLCKHICLKYHHLKHVIYINWFNRVDR